ncbi:PHD finger protein 21B isoform X2 [Hippocampus comes]|uniref:PHD finger protein 21B isoform X2 n=1 Tax=Hippocampus comes TaxID=109280 RepID=UPI00094E6F05|nr:PREDICTED: PHD finger protein 21B isoform X2 [Hippocampus comes]
MIPTSPAWCRSTMESENPTLCKGLNELGSGQKLAVRSCPVAASKPPSLIKPPSQAIAISAVPAAHLNGQKVPAGSEPQTGLGVALGGGGHPPGAGTAPDLPPTQMTGSLGSGPLKVPRVSSLHRLAGQAAGVLPQVRPKTLIPDSLPRSPRQEPPQAPQRRRSSALAGSSGGGGAGAGAGVAYAIIAASPARANGVAAVSEAVKVIIIQPQAPRDGEGGALGLPSQEPPPDPAGSPSRKIDEDPEKISFMVALGLVTNEHLEEIQLRRQERKRRSTANPAYSGLLEPERKRLPSHYLNGPLFASARDSEDFCWKDEAERDGQLRPCDDCPRAFCPDCLQPPPAGPRYCPKCHKKVPSAESAPWPRDVTHKTARREEKRRLLRRHGELKEECAHLEEEDQQLNKTLQRCLDRRDRLAARQRDALAALERLKALIGLIRVTETDGAAPAPSAPPSRMRSGPSVPPFWTSPDNHSP